MSILEAHFFMYTQDQIVFEQRQHEYEVMRMQAFYSPWTNFKNCKQIRKPSDLIGFQWDKKDIPININPEDYTEDAFKELDKKYANIKPVKRKRLLDQSKNSIDDGE